MNTFQYFAQNTGQILKCFLEHIQLTGIAVCISLLIGVPLGILICRFEKLSKLILGLSNVVQAIPSMALLGFLIPVLGIGVKPAIVAVILYSLLPIIKNTYTGILNIDKDMIESATGIGLTKWQVLRKIQIPLALPMIMAGVRISAVTAVGLVTIAAFIGAGGLGFLVFSGIRTVNNNQILAGAIPACLLALIVDYIVGVVEKLVAPISIQEPTSRSRANIKRHQKRKQIILASCLVAIGGLFIHNSLQGVKKEARVLTVGGKDFTEQSIVVNLVSQMIENETNIKVNRVLELGGTQICFNALKAGEIDMYIEYSGTAYKDTLSLSATNDVAKIYETVKREFKEQFNIDVLPQMDFNNTFVLAVKPEMAAKYKLETISDLTREASNLRLGSTLEFLNRDDGYPGLRKLYGLEMKKSIGIDGSSRYLALMNGEVEVVDAYATDGIIKKFDLVMLTDDKSFFPPYYAMPIMRGEASEEFPEVIDILARLGALLTNEVMVELNYKVDELQMNPEDVSREFLQIHELI